MVIDYLGTKALINPVGSFRKQESFEATEHTLQYRDNHEAIPSTCSVSRLRWLITLSIIT